jgi:hypothetical protein
MSFVESRRLRGAIMVLTALAAAATVLWMQGRYEAADQKNALEIVQAYHPPGGTSIPALLAARHPGKLVSWTTAVESSCFQHIRVHAVVEEAEPVLYAFVVDINGPSIHPANDNGQVLMGALDKPPPPSASGASSADPSSVAPKAALSSPQESPP